MLTGRCQPPPVTWAGGVCFTHTPTEKLPPGRDPQSRASNAVPGKIQQKLHCQQQFMEGSRKMLTELFLLDQRGPQP